MNAMNAMNTNEADTATEDKERLKMYLQEYRQKVLSGEIADTSKYNPLERAKANPKSRSLAIKGYCYDCSGGSTAEVKLCVSTGCPLYNFRV